MKKIIVPAAIVLAAVLAFFFWPQDDTLHGIVELTEKAHDLASEHVQTVTFLGLAETEESAVAWFLFDHGSAYSYEAMLCDVLAPDTYTYVHRPDARHYADGVYTLFHGGHLFFLTHEADVASLHVTDRVQNTTEIYDIPTDTDPYAGVAALPEEARYTFYGADATDLTQ